jgi:hypothetical protein
MEKISIAIALLLIGLALAIDTQYQAFTTAQPFSYHLALFKPDIWSMIIGNALGVVGIRIFSVSVRRRAE